MLFEEKPEIVGKEYTDVPGRIRDLMNWRTAQIEAEDEAGEKSDSDSSDERRPVKDLMNWLIAQTEVEEEVGESEENSND